MNAKPRGRQFFNNPGPTNIPDRVLRAIDRPVLDFMSDEFVAIHHACHAGVKRVLKTDQTLYMYNASGHGAWEAALANLFAAGDTVLIVETGYFSVSWAEMATNLGIKAETFAADWRQLVISTLCRCMTFRSMPVSCRPKANPHTTQSGSDFATSFR